MFMCMARLGITEILFPRPSGNTGAALSGFKTDVPVHSAHLQIGRTDEEWCFNVLQAYTLAHIGRDLSSHAMELTSAVVQPINATLGKQIDAIRSLSEALRFRYGTSFCMWMTSAVRACGSSKHTSPIGCMTAVRRAPVLQSEHAPLSLWVVLEATA